MRAREKNNVRLNQIKTKRRCFVSEDESKDDEMYHSVTLLKSTLRAIESNEPSKYTEFVASVRRIMNTEVVHVVSLVNGKVRSVFTEQYIDIYAGLHQLCSQVLVNGKAMIVENKEDGKKNCFLAVPCKKTKLIFLAINKLDKSSFNGVDICNIENSFGCIRNVYTTKRNEEAAINTATNFERYRNFALSLLNVNKTDVQFEQLFHMAKTVLNCQLATFYVYDSNTRQLWTAVTNFPSGVKIAYGENIPGWAAEHKSSCNVRDCYKDSRFNPNVDVHFGSQSRSTMVIPIFHNKSLFGVVEFINKQCAAAEDEELGPAKTQSYPTQDRPNVFEHWGTSSKHNFVSYLRKYNGDTKPKRRKSKVRNKNETMKPLTYFTESDEKLAALFCESISHVVTRDYLDLQNYIRFKFLVSSQRGRQHARSINIQLMDSIVRCYQPEVDAVPRPSNVQIIVAIGKFLKNLKKFREAVPENENFPEIQETYLEENVLELFSKPCPQVFTDISQLYLQQDASFMPFTEWSFDVLAHSEEELNRHICTAISTLGIKAKFRIPADKLDNFLNKLQKGYEKHPYHNWYHAVSVFQQMYAILRKTQASAHLECHDLLSMVIASLGHDVGHSGKTNNFECKSFSDLSLRYNDVSILEHHHASLTSRYLMEENSNILVNLSGAKFREVRKLVICHILNTDISKHNELLQNVALVSQEAQLGEAQQRELIGSFIIHCCDIGAQTMAPETAEKWASRVKEEFSEQVKDEERLELAITPHMANLQDPVTWAQVQRGFISFIVQPAWEALEAMFPECHICIEQLQSNMEKYIDVINRDQD